MKKILFIAALLLFGSVGTNIFGYDWNVVNNSDDILNVTLCNTSTCQTERIQIGEKRTFSFGGIQAGLVYGSLTINGQDYSNTMPSQLHTIIGFGGTFAVRGNSRSGYTFSG